MEVILENVRQYVLALIKAGDFSQKDVADASTVPLETVRNFVTGKTIKNVGFATVAKMIVALGGDLNAAIGYEIKKEIETNSTLSLKETHDMRVEELVKTYEARIEDIKVFCDMRVDECRQNCELRIADLRRNYEERLEEQKQLLLSINK